MDPEAILAQLRHLFEYRPDGALDSWRVMRIGPNGRLAGDCDDFAVTLAFRLAGRSWPRFLWHLFTFKSVIWYCTSTQGNPHAVLWHRGAGWADNMAPIWQARTPHRRHFPWVFPGWAIKMVLGLFYRA